MTEQPLRIIHCFRSPVGGIFRHVRDLVNYHSEQGHKIGILCDSSTGGEHEDKLFETILPKLELGLQRIEIGRAVTPKDFIAARKVYKEIKSLQPDVLHGHGAKGGAYVRLMGSFLRGSRSRVTRFYSPHGGTLHYKSSSLQGKAYFAVERFLERWTDGLVFVSDYERKTYFDKVGKPTTDWDLVYNGLTEQDFEPIVDHDDAVDFLYIGMMRDLKGPDVFIDALRVAERITGRPLTAHMVGDGPDKENYQLKIHKMGLGERIKMHPAMMARDAFALAKNVVIPSRAEAMPYIVLETVAAQKPIICTNVGGIPEIMGEDCASMVTPGDADALGAIMAKAADEKDWLKTCLPDRAEFTQRFSVKTMAENLTEIYQKAGKKAA